MALLLTSLQAFKRAGLESATLDTATHNPTEAIRLYQQAGFREAWRWITYGMEIEWGVLHSLQTEPYTAVARPTIFSTIRE